MTALEPTAIALYLAAGLALGTAYFVLLSRLVHLHVRGAAGLRAVPLHVGRIALAVLAFWLIAHQGAYPLLSALLGFMIARFAVQRLLRWE